MPQLYRIEERKGAVMLPGVPIRRILSDPVSAMVHTRTVLVWIGSKEAYDGGLLKLLPASRTLESLMLMPQLLLLSVGDAPEGNSILVIVIFFSCVVFDLTDKQ